MKTPTATRKTSSGISHGRLLLLLVAPALALGLGGAALLLLLWLLAGVASFVGRPLPDFLAARAGSLAPLFARL